MSDKLQFFKATIVERVTDESTPRQLDIYLSVDAISHVVPMQTDNPYSNYKVYIKNNYPFYQPFPIQSISAAPLTADQIQLIN